MATYIDMPKLHMSTFELCVPPLMASGGRKDGVPALLVFLSIHDVSKAVVDNSSWHVC